MTRRRYHAQERNTTDVTGRIVACVLQAIGKDDHNFMFKGQRAVYNKQITTTTGKYLSEQYVKNRASSPLSAWKKDYIAAGKPRETSYQACAFTSATAAC
jgi:hypothetical protein